MQSQLTNFIAPQSILITGASSGIGEALAELYAAPAVTLFLAARNLERLQKVADRCRAKGAHVEVASIDVTDTLAMRNFINHIDAVVPLDLVIANAGISNAGKETKEEFDREIFAINFNGVLNTVYPALDLMKQRGQGQIAIVSSMVAFCSLPRAVAYSTSKAAVKTFGEALRGRAKKFGVAVNVICPGFIKTPLTDKNSYAMPFIMSAAKAATIIKHKLAKNRGLIVFPKRFYSFFWVLRLLPFPIVEKITSYF